MGKQYVPHLLLSRKRSYAHIGICIGISRRMAANEKSSSPRWDAIFNFHLGMSLVMHASHPWFIPLSDLDELLSKVSLNSSRKQGKSAPFAIIPVLLMQNFLLQNGQNYLTHSILFLMWRTLRAYAGVCTLLRQTLKHLSNAGAIDLRII